jgi:hypothetical protein
MQKRGKKNFEEEQLEILEKLKFEEEQKQKLQVYGYHAEEC